MTKLDSPVSNFGPKIVVVGIGGAGGNAVNNMIRSNLEGVIFVVANTDAQALSQSLVDEKCRIQLGLTVTQGLGAGSKPDVGKAAAEESSEDILGFIKDSNMVFITAGMGGGTGTGAAPVIARIARDAGILTVGVVTRPFLFEGANRSKAADSGICDLQQYVDTLLVIPNQNLFRVANEDTTFADAFRMADNVLYSGVRGVTDLMIMPGLINLDFADIRAVMGEMGKAMMGTGEGSGERRALDAAEAAISNPLLDDVSLDGARGILISITGGYDMTLYEVDEAANRIREAVDPDANIIFGSTFDERLKGMIRVSVVATGIGSTQEGIFKRDVSGIIGLGRKDQNSRVFDDVFSRDDPAQGYEEQNLESADESDKAGSHDDIEGQDDTASEKNRRRSYSFFERFGARARKDGFGDRQQQPDRRRVQQDGSHAGSQVEDEQENLDIPSCFRKKK
jgi:cell division protein FtsZ